jgi:hypothetical protein
VANPTVKDTIENTLVKYFGEKGINVNKERDYVETWEGAEYKFSELVNRLSEEVVRAIENDPARTRETRQTDRTEVRTKFVDLLKRHSIETKLIEDKETIVFKDGQTMPLDEVTEFYDTMMYRETESSASPKP